GRAAEAGGVVVEARADLGLVGGVADQHGVAADDAALQLVEPGLAAELGRLAGLAPADQRGVRLEQAEHLVGGRDLLAAQHPPGRLVDDPADQRREPVQTSPQPSGRRTRAAWRRAAPTTPKSRSYRTQRSASMPVQPCTIADP